MASKYWIKLYHEILDDPKMGLMPDHLWRRTIEIFLLAGEYDQEGLLPPPDQIAWRLRISPEECNETLQELMNCNILVTNENGQYTVKSFAQRQAKVPVAERVRRYRERQAKNPTPEPEKPDNSSKNGNNSPENSDNSQKSGKPVTPMSNDNVTKRYTDTDTDTESDSNYDDEKRARAPNELDQKWGKIYSLWCNNINLSESPITIQEMQTERYLSLPYVWWQESVKIACDNNSRKWSYVRAILDRSAKIGQSPLTAGPPGKHGKAGRDSPPAAGPLPAWGIALNAKARKH